MANINDTAIFTGSCADQRQPEIDIEVHNSLVPVIKELKVINPSH